MVTLRLIFLHTAMVTLKRYMMFEPLSDENEPNLGSLSAFLKREDEVGAIVLTPIWSLQNFQGLTWYFGQAPLRADGDFQVGFQCFVGSFLYLCLFCRSILVVWDYNHLQQRRQTKNLRGPNYIWVANLRARNGKWITVLWSLAFHNCVCST